MRNEEREALKHVAEIKRNLGDQAEECLYMHDGKGGDRFLALQLSSST